jgi:hypothetical protein
LKLFPALHQSVGSAFGPTFRKGKRAFARLAERSAHVAAPSINVGDERLARRDGAFKSSSSSSSNASSCRPPSLRGLLV